MNAVTRRLADTSKAARLIGFKTGVGIDEGLRCLVEWWLAQGDVERQRLAT